jgi:hypothetical protein
VFLAGWLLLAAASANAQEAATAPDAASAPDARSPRIALARVDWDAALMTLAPIAELPANAEGTGVDRALPHLNLAASLIFRNIAASPVPVLLPFDTEAYLQDYTAGSVDRDLARYGSGIEPPKFFLTGPSGYDAAFVVRPAAIPDLADIKFAEPIHVQISGSALVYELDGPDPAARGAPVPELDARFPGIRRLLHEANVRYTFVRFGVPYVVSLECFNASVSRFRLMPCKQADRVLTHVLAALRVVGGKPGAARPASESAKIERPEKVSSTFHYYGAGRLVARSGARGLGGSLDNTVYANIRFPLADAPAHAASQVYWSRSKPIGGEDPNVYTWRDNFCERRGFTVGQCPGGIGHQGQDIRPAPCKPSEGGEPCRRRHDLVAVRDGAILRLPKQEAVYLVVNSATEHVRFRYLHMHPRKMDEDNLLSGRFVREGEVIGQVSNYSRKEAGTSYHLHIDLQVPTKDGWVFVNPYMTLVAAYERLIGERGREVKEDLPPTVQASVPPPPGQTPVPPPNVQASVPPPATKVIAEHKPTRYATRGKRGHKARGSHSKREKIVHSKKIKVAAHRTGQRGGKNCGRRCR